MFKEGLIDEVKKLLKMGYTEELNSMQGLGYQQVVDYLKGKIPLEEAVRLVARDTRRYAKRQYTWFSRDKNIIWLDISKDGKKKTIANIVQGVEGKTKNT